ncbi:unnamed protein product [Effrenium voratum]|uniref:Methyltransferase type 11 domain-containing protein n=1 Tax=Effrenium voratum TaxID=2562239 RepID=A0AA36IF06_9DINO|nr:unnamed protein product [Effrenium voratum]
MAVCPERGRCLSCASQGARCVPGLPCHPNCQEDLKMMHLPEQAYRRSPLLPSLKKRLASWSRETPAAQASTCGACGCSVTDHEAMLVSSGEQRILEVCRRLFQPFELTLGIRQSVQDTACLGLGRVGFTYGEVSLLSFLRLLDRVACIQSGHAVEPGAFYDLGCGVGKTLVLAALHGIGFHRCVGVELLPGLAAAARILCENFRAEGAAAVVEVVEDDMEQVPLEGASMVLLNAGSWTEPSLSILRRRLAQALPDGGVVATVRHPIAKAGEGLEPVEELRLPMSWGEASVYLAQKGIHRRLKVVVDLNEMD